MEELSWEYGPEEDAHEMELEPLDPEAFYKSLKIALRLQAQAAAEELQSTGQLGVG